MLKRCVLRLHLKMARVFVDLMDSGRLFQTVGPTTEKARSTNLDTFVFTEQRSPVAGGTKMLFRVATGRRNGFSQVQGAMIVMNHEHHECHLILDAVSD